MSVTRESQERRKVVNRPVLGWEPRVKASVSETTAGHQSGARFSRRNEREATKESDNGGKEEQTNKKGTYRIVYGILTHLVNVLLSCVSLLNTRTCLANNVARIVVVAARWEELEEKQVAQKKDMQVEDGTDDDDDAIAEEIGEQQQAAPNGKSIKIQSSSKVARGDDIDKPRQPESAKKAVGKHHTVLEYHTFPHTLHDE